MLSNPRSRTTARLAAGSVLAATALASGAFAALGATAAHADGTPGSYANADALNWGADPASAVINVPDTISQLSSLSLTLHGVTTPDVTGLHMSLAEPDGTSQDLLSNPATVAGNPAVNNADVTFSSDQSDASAEPSYPGSLAYDVNNAATGNWTLTVSDDNGTVGSIHDWALAITEAPFVTSSTDEQIVDSGKDATFTAVAEGIPAPTVQWQVSTDGGDTFANIEGANSPSYTVTAPTTASDRNMYQAVFTSAAGTGTSNAAMLRVNGTAPKVTQQPQAASVVAGTAPTFTAAATGDPAITSVRWEKSTDNGASYQPISGANTASYTLDHAAALADSGSMFRAVFANDVDETATAPAKLTVSGQLPSAPRNVTAIQTGPGAFTIHWAPSVDGGSPALSGYDAGWGAGQMGNGETVAASATFDTFKNLAPGTYTASVAAVNAAGESTRIFVPIKVVAPTATPNAAVSTKHVIAGGKFVLSGVGPASKTLTIQRALPGKSFVTLTTVKSNSWGAYSATIAATHTAAYRVVAAASKVSNKVTVAAAYGVHVQSVRTAARAYTIRGWITPVAAGRTVHVTATVAGKLVKIATLATSKKGQYTTHYKFAKTGGVTLHVTVSSGAQNASGALNKALKVS